MTPAEFLKAVWPTHGLYCLATIFITPQGKAVYSHKIFNTIDAAANFAARHKNEDIYFCIHSLKAERVWNPRKQNPKTGEMGDWSIRTQSNMQEASAFFFDLDVGDEDGKYPSQRDALIALKQFIVDTGLPYPMLTSSGGGLHVYWLVDASLTSKEWLTTATRMKALAAHHGLKVDPSRTTDTASVLRVAGTFNMKDKSNPRPVQVLKKTKPVVLDDFIKIVANAVTRAGVTADVLQPKKKTYTEPDDWFGESNMGPMQFDGPPTKFSEVLKACPLMVDLSLRAATLSNPEWYNGLGVVAWCDNGRAVAHKWSAKYAGYNPSETDAKIDQQLQFQPTSCAKLEEVCGSAQCAKCPFHNKVKNPLAAARRVTEKEFEKVNVGSEDEPVMQMICPPPKPYKILKSGAVVIVSTNSEGEETSSVIYDRPVYPLRRVRNDDHEQELIMWRVEHIMKGPRNFVLEADALADSRKLNTDLMKKGEIYIDPEQLGLMRSYMVAYIRELQRRQLADAQHNYLGWNDEMTEFSLHDRALCQNGTTKIIQLSTHARNAAKAMGRKGTLEKQVELLKFFDHPDYIPNQVMILQGLAAPIFYATGHNGVIVNATGEPGASKSTALYTAASMFGDPEKYPINGTKDGATYRARAGIITALSNLPICVDEITEMDPADVANLAMGISQARQRDRLGPDGVLRTVDVENKSTIMLTTANCSLHGLLAQHGQGTTAGAVRVIEIRFVNPGIHEKWDAEEYLYQLKQNFGHIGPAFIQHWLTDMEGHRLMVRAKMKELDQKGRIKPGERFWGSNYGALLTAGRIAKEQGLIPYDIDAIQDWLLNFQLPTMRGTLTQEFAGPVALLTDFLAEITGDMVVTQKMNNNVDTVRKPRGPMLAHYDMDKQVIWVLRAAFRDYCNKRKVNYLTALDDLRNPRVSQPGQPVRIVPQANLRKTLGAGTDYANGQAWVFEIDMRHPEISGVLPVVANENPALSPARGSLKVVKP